MRVQVTPPIADTSIFRITDSPSSPLPYNVIQTILYNTDSAARHRERTLSCACYIDQAHTKQFASICTIVLLMVQEFFLFILLFFL